MSNPIPIQKRSPPTNLLVFQNQPMKNQYGRKQLEMTHVTKSCFLIGQHHLHWTSLFVGNNLKSDHRSVSQSERSHSEPSSQLEHDLVNMDLFVQAAESVLATHVSNTRHLMSHVTPCHVTNVLTQCHVSVLCVGVHIIYHMMKQPHLTVSCPINRHHVKYRIRHV